MRHISILLALSFGALAWVSTAIAQPLAEERSIFQRFGSGRVAPENWQLMPEIPVFLRPQFDPDAEIVNNSGANLVVAFRPRNRIYFSRSYDFAQMSWKPKSGSVKKVELTSFDISEMINFSVKRLVIITFGLGLGVMDGLIVRTEDRFRTRLEPFIPIQLGLGLLTGSAFTVAVKVSQHFFFGPGPGVSLTRGLIGVGYNF